MVKHQKVDNADIRQSAVPRKKMGSTIIEIKKQISLLLIIIILAVMSACGSASNKGNLTSASGITVDDIAQAITENGWCDYVFTGQQLGNSSEGTMIISSTEISKRMTDEQSDIIWVTVDMADNQFSRKSYLKVTYINYTQGGWILETIEREEPSEFSKIGQPQSEECEYPVRGKFSQYTFVNADGDGKKFACSYAVNEDHQNCRYTGNATVNMNLCVANQAKPNLESCYWECSVDTSDVVVDWTKACGTYSCMEEYQKARWELLRLQIENGSDNSLAISGLLTDETARSYVGVVGASWPFTSNAASYGKFDNTGTEQSLSLSATLGEGVVYENNYRAGYDDIVERFLRYNDNTSKITVEIHPDYIECTYYLIYDNNFSYGDGLTCRVEKISQ